MLQELGFQLGPKGKPLVATLPSEVFREVLANLQSGVNARRMDRGGSGGRIRNVRFCLLEAEHEKDKDFIKSAATMVLLRDERFATCTKDLEVRCGTAGAMRDYGSPTAENLVKGNAAGAHSVLHSQVGEAPNHDRVEGAGGGS